MKNDRKTLVATAAILAASALTLARPVMAKVDTIDDEMLRMQGEFEIGNGDQFTLHYGRHPVTYRVCVKELPGIVPLKVTVDGKTEEVLDGTCENVIGSHIAVGPAKMLKTDEILIGKYEFVKK
jgi:hypothetical protein